MKSAHSDPYSDHPAVSLLLPWYVNKTLHADELVQVEAHLNVCLTCQREVINLRKLALAVRQPLALNTSESEQAAFTQFKQRLQQTRPPQSTETVINLEQHKAAKQPVLPRKTYFRPALAMAAMLLLSLLIPHYFKLNQVISHDYRTLSEGDLAATNPNEVHLVFADHTTPQQILDLLAPFSGQIIGQPSTQGVYTVRFEQTHSKAMLLEQLALLKKQPQVVFAEPAYTQLSTPTAEPKSP